uniref:AAA+ ATPase domain-containing protein n=1 Tax=Chromera velia CCMP2878 TaxID=1169474 RepID=A0A0G4HF91_9ALVE|eukprot:Cvel_6633.t1-p1 / transcript=Cvel_6633.t1 / gene=Cvel_6633 / organism=Chromera_velia_CCMP2878 / gene_product=Fidgetin-like protein 1, putative / transcript_product=Fidgetin-like protein 1, putative / location=Cvel_scaffold328:86548-92618(+) / protein_length=512 / sequence_SO=supercontig / SO=protein_coding / is_pseudo=false
MGCTSSSPQLEAQRQKAEALAERAEAARGREDLEEADVLYGQAIDKFQAYVDDKDAKQDLKASLKNKIAQLQAAKADVIKKKSAKAAPKVNPAAKAQPSVSGIPGSRMAERARQRAEAAGGGGEEAQPPPAVVNPYKDLYEENKNSQSQTESQGGGRGGAASGRGARGVAVARGRGRGGGGGGYVPPARGGRGGGGAVRGGRGGAAAGGAPKPKLDEHEEKLANEILDQSPSVGWNQIAGLAGVKATLQEIVIAPNLNPDIFSGLRAPPKGVLLFGPPGNGKTMIAKAVAAECGATFFNISASSITSKWMGESEKQMRALFSLAAKRQPCVIFIDEIDSLLTARHSGEHEASRRVKTEFLVQLDGVATSGTERILVLGATNRPQELDDAALRRMVKRIYIPLPDVETRKALIVNLLKDQPHEIDGKNLQALLKLSEGYSGSDLSALCKEAAMAPVRGIPASELKQMKAEQLRKITLQDFKDALRVIRPSVGPESLKAYETWNDRFGTKATTS